MSVKLPTRVVIESPYAGDIEQNKRYLQQCMRDCIMNHEEAPTASHQLYTDCLDDNCGAERAIGLELGYAWMDVAEYVVVYTDLGVSGGMKAAIEHAEKIDIQIEFRRLPKEMLEIV